MRVQRREGFKFVTAQAWRWPGVFAAVTYLNTRRQREIVRDERLLWVLLALIALAPELILIGRILVKGR